MTILRRLKKTHEIFIVEMGAYKKKEIERICRIAPPDIGIITGLGHQHQELFGSYEDIIRAKFELVENLKKNGVVIFNGNNPHLEKIISWTKEKRKDLSIWQSVYNQDKLTPDNYDKVLFVTEIKQSKDKITFFLTYKGKKIKCSASLTGKHHVENIASSAIASLVLGSNLADIAKRIHKLKPPAKTMQRMKGLNRSTFIDDTFNASFESVLSSIEAIRKFSGKKILILTPVIELGSFSKEAHRKIGETAAKSCDIIFLTNTNYDNFILEGARKVEKGNEKIYFLNPEAVCQKIILETSQNTTVLFEGKEAKKIMDLLIKR